MPVYEYCCPSCGPFEEFAAMSAAGNPAACPSCGRAGSRVYSLAVGSVTGSPGERALRDRVGSGEPRRETRATSGTGHAPHGNASGQRPWMIGH